MMRDTWHDCITCLDFRYINIRHGSERPCLLKHQQEEKTSLLSCQSLDLSCNLTDLITTNNVNMGLWAHTHAHTNNSSQLLLLPLISSALPKQQRAMRWPNLRSVPLQDVCSTTVRGGRWGPKKKNPSKCDSQSGLSRMESVCAGEGFYQRLTLTGIPVWDCTSNSCVPQEAAHKKQRKRPRTFHMSPVGSLGAPRASIAGLFMSLRQLAP